MADDYRIEVFEESAVSADDVLDLWRREAAVPDAEARRRVHEVHLVAIHATDGLAALSTAYLQRNDQLGMDMWYYRAFTAAAHRTSNVAVQLTERGRNHLTQRFTSGTDARGAGIIFEVENEGLKRGFPEALWLPLEFSFIGENAHGDHVRVHYFPGATVAIPAGRA